MKWVRFWCGTLFIFSALSAQENKPTVAQQESSVALEAEPSSFDRNAIVGIVNQYKAQYGRK